ncbi:MAG: type II toxin-antitoxin system VapC family toxin [Sneathiellaceae bacterium]
MSLFVIDASVAIKWVIAEDGSDKALSLRREAHRSIAPDLLVAECANILRKKVQRAQISAAEAHLAARLLQAADVEILPARNLLEQTTRLAVDLGHPACDCLYLALAVANDCRFTTDGTTKEPRGPREDRIHRRHYAHGESNKQRTSPP